MGQDKGNRQIPDCVGMRIRLLREEKGYSLDYLGKLAKCSASYIDRIEKGDRRSPSYPLLENIANALNVTIADLMGTEETETTQVRSVYDILAQCEYMVKGTIVSREDREGLISLLKSVLEGDDPTLYKVGTLIVQKAKELWELVHQESRA